MRWRKCDLWKIGITGASMLFLLVLLVWVPISEVDAHQQNASAMPVTGATIVVQATPTVDATVTALNKEQLGQQVVGQQRTLDNWLWSNAATILSSFLSTLVIVIGALFGLWRWRSDRRDAQDKELKDQENERDKRADERFQAVVTGLGNDKEGARIGVAILLRTFLRPGYEEFYTQTFDLAVANLRILSTSIMSEDTTPPLPLTTLRRALIIVFRESFPLARDRLKAESSRFSPQALDATGIQLDNAYLRFADLKQVWMPQASLQKTDLSFANLHEANLFEKANLYKVNLGGANLSKAMLYGANLREANLYEADLREANIGGADLSKATLYGANLSKASLHNANLSGANLDKAMLYGANLGKANLSEVKHLEEAQSLEGTNLRGAKGLTKAQLATCKAKGAIVDEDPTTSASQSTVAPASPPQRNDAQAPSASSAQGSVPTPDLSESSPLSPPAQSSDVQTSSVPLAQGSPLSPDTNGSNASPSKPDSGF